MAQVINTNVASLNAQRNLNTSQSALATSLQRLSSGLRINSAKDDAAGLAISERFTTQIRGLNQATRNANDGISLAQTGEGALAEITSNLQRIRELAVQSANATNSASDRAALDLEVQQRIAEIDRTATQTSFNGQKILDGSFGTAAFQIGANVGETISIGLSTSMRSSAIGKVATAAGSASVTGPTPANATITGGVTAAAYTTNIANYAGVDSNAIDSGANKVTINGTVINGSASYAVTGGAASRAADSAYAKAAAINATGLNGVSATATTEWNVGDAGTGLLVDGATADITAGDTMGYSLTINGTEVIDDATTGLLTSTKETLTIDDAITYINQKSADTGVIASKDTDGKLVLNAADGRNITVQEAWTFTDGGSASDSSGTYTSAFGSATVTDDATDTADSGTALHAAITHRGQVTLTSSSDIAISSGLTVIGHGSASILATGSLEAKNVLSVTNANATINSIDSALTAVSTLRSSFGAIQNRFESTISNLQATSENLSASRSRIQDADFASETASLTRAQILQQSGIAMLGQANALPNNVLSLLR